MPEYVVRSEIIIWTHATIVQHFAEVKLEETVRKNPDDSQAIRRKSSSFNTSSQHPVLKLDRQSLLDVRDSKRYGELVWLLMRPTGLHCRARGPAAANDFSTAGAAIRVRKHYI